LIIDGYENLLRWHWAQEGILLAVLKLIIEGHAVKFMHKDRK